MEGLGGARKSQNGIIVCGETLAEHNKRVCKVMINIR